MWQTAAAAGCASVKAKTGSGLVARGPAWIWKLSFPNVPARFAKVLRAITGAALAFANLHTGMAALEALSDKVPAYCADKIRRTERTINNWCLISWRSWHPELLAPCFFLFSYFYYCYSGAKNREKASRVVYFLHPFFLFMSFSFYQPWVNTAHVNDILTQRAMNNAFEFTFMPESYPSQHLPPPLFPFLPQPPPPPPFSPPPSCLFLSSLFILIRAQPHFSFPQPHLSSALLTLHLPPSFHQTADRKRCRIRLALPPPNTYCISVYYPGYCSGGCCSLMYLHIHGFRIGTLARFSFLAEVKRAHSFLQASVQKKKKKLQ